MRKKISPGKILKTDFPACEDYRGYEKLICIYINLSKNSSFKIDREQDNCRKIITEPYKSECQYFSVVSRILSGKNLPTNNFDELENSCKEIMDPFFSSECYFNLADELSFLNDKKLFLKIYELCEKSTRKANFFCFSHINFSNRSLNLAFIKEYSYKEKIFCFIQTGQILLNKSGDNPVKAFELCREHFDKKNGLEQCYKGIANFFGRKTVKGNLENRCSEIPSEYRMDCLKSIGEVMANYTFSDFEKTDFLGFCKKNRILYKINDCVANIFGAFFYLNSGEIQQSIGICKKSEQVKNICFSILVFIINKYYLKSFIEQENYCKTFPKDYWHFCNTGIIDVLLKEKIEEEKARL